MHDVENISEERLSAIKSSVLSRVNQSEEDIPMKKHFSAKPLIIAAAVSATALTSLITANAASDLSANKYIAEESQPNITENDTTNIPNDTAAEEAQPDITENDTTNTPADTTEGEDTYKILIEGKDVDITVDGRKTTTKFYSYVTDEGEEISNLWFSENECTEWMVGFIFRGGDEVLDNLKTSGEPFTYEANGKTVTVKFL